ncbi:MAG: hypothetical protein DMG47_01300 [Acidobacteria bacterium]|nr:MAG: hypothetical protein DMG47_01300 [Acidobacteriota bacterium]
MTLKFLGQGPKVLILRIEYGNIAAALSTTRAGGTEAFRDRQHLEAFLQSANVRRSNSNTS